jgi:hypothetical protein
MSISAVVFEGVRRAATCAALLFTLNAPVPAAAQPPAAVRGNQALFAVDGSLAATGLTLVAHHVDVRIAGGSASVQQQLLLRNDSAAEVSVQYLLPNPARIVRDDLSALPDRGTPASLRDDADLSPQAAEFAEAGPGRLVRRHDVIVVAPGEQIVVEVERQLPVAAVGGVHRLQLPLPVDPAAPWVPRFTADVMVEAEQPIRRLASPTHPVLVDGLGEQTALLSVADGVVHRQAQLAVEFELEAGSRARPALALGRASASRNQ